MGGGFSPDEAGTSNGGLEPSRRGGGHLGMWGGAGACGCGGGGGGGAGSGRLIVPLWNIEESLLSERVDGVVVFPSSDEETSPFSIS